MPLYEYECTACHRHTEKIQKFSDPEITVCPHCGGTLERVLSAPAISFKGGGWYADGYGNAKPKSTGASDTKSDTKSAASGSGSSSESSAAPASAPAATAAPAAATAPAAASSDKK
ncbi:MAG: FmdB family transcriptional regulator [Acidobacteriales bacterium 59-55]|nr:zinc ribbon domain-containing protein [Terriglobales bacterium]ODU55185.1 MAG: FmdB family transcriptional regulator [Granulicella sp. SCN 62-9]OJV44085.1 MAG: FmdB family transcriptional regulator [Acidobacteriales bacterium 59-55]